jgi:hypothetical protein
VVLTQAQLVEPMRCKGLARRTTAAFGSSFREVDG